jgi:hypothetical protein
MKLSWSRFDPGPHRSSAARTFYVDAAAFGGERQRKSGNAFFF